jgi:hypothetical protein
MKQKKTNTVKVVMKMNIQGKRGRDSSKMR